MSVIGGASQTSETRRVKQGGALIDEGDE